VGLAQLAPIAEVYWTSLKIDPKVQAVNWASGWRCWVGAQLKAHPRPGRI
jgi:hypothetical protein